MSRIIGVVGSKGTPEVLALAREVGRCIRANDAVVMSGGRHDECGRHGEELPAVKVAALKGAMQAAAGSPPARMLGILKEGTPYPRLEQNDLRAAYISTGMDHARNLLNALVAGGLIALPGKAADGANIREALRVLVRDQDRYRAAASPHRQPMQYGC